MDSLPILYLPKGVPSPAWAGIFPGGMDLLCEGPDGRSGGRIFGANWNPSRQWTKCADYWISGEIRPQALRRATVSPRFKEWVAVSGAHVGHAWAVPILLKIIRAENGSEAVMHALSPTLGPNGWDHGDASKVLHKYMRSCEALNTGGTLSDDDIIDLAVDLLSVGHWCDRDLLAALHMLDATVIESVIRSAIGRDP